MNTSIEVIIQLPVEKSESWNKVKQLDQEFPFPWSENAWEELRKNWQGHLLLLLRCEDDVVGFVLFGLGNDALAHLYKIVVRLDCRGRGFGRKLLKFAIDQLQRISFEKIFLEVEESNSSAINLYKSFGFSQLHLAKNFYGPGRHGIKMLLEILNT